MAGAVADECWPRRWRPAGRWILLICRTIERARPAGQFAVDGAASATAYVRRKVNERGEWAAKRVAAGRALVDRLPMSAKTWEAGRLGLEHAVVIDRATRALQDPELVAELDRILAEAAADGLDPTDLARLAEHVRAQTVPDRRQRKPAGSITTRPCRPRPRWTGWCTFRGCWTRKPVPCSNGRWPCSPPNQTPATKTWTDRHGPDGRVPAG